MRAYWWQTPENEATLALTSHCHLSLSALFGMGSPRSRFKNLQQAKCLSPCCTARYLCMLQPCRSCGTEVPLMYDHDHQINYFDQVAKLSDIKVPLLSSRLLQSTQSLYPARERVVSLPNLQSLRELNSYCSVDQRIPSRASNRGGEIIRGWIFMKPDDSADIGTRYRR